MAIRRRVGFSLDNPDTSHPCGRPKSGAVGCGMAFHNRSSAHGHWLAFAEERWPERGSGRFGAPPGVAAVVIIASFVSAYPLSGQKFTTVLLRPGLGPNSALELAAAVDARLVWADSSGELAVLQADANISPLDLYSYGAMFVSNAMIGSGCLGWETSSGPLEITS